MADDDIERAVDWNDDEERAEAQAACPHKIVRLELSAPLTLYAPSDVLTDKSFDFVHGSFSALVDAYVVVDSGCRGQAQCSDCDAALDWDSEQVAQALANAAKVAHKHMAWELVT